MDVKVIALILTLNALSLTPSECAGKTLGSDEEVIFKGYTKCLSQGDCEYGYCCTLGMQRYSVPVCSRLGQKSDPCIPSNLAPRNYSLSYPNISGPLEVTAYRLYCPCDRGFICQRKSNTCQEGLGFDKPLKNSTNDLHV